MASALGSFFTALVNFDFPPLPQPQIATRIAPAWNCLITGITWKKPGGRTKAKTRVQKTFQPSRLEVLPQELLCEVLNLLDHRDQKGLRLLNRCLEQIATPHPFRHIQLSPSLGSYQRLRALSRQPRLNKLVKHVTFHTNTCPKELSLQDFKSSLTRSIFALPKKSCHTSAGVLSTSNTRTLTASIPASAALKTLRCNSHIPSVV